MVNGKQVNLLAVNSRVDALSKVVNPYTVGLRTNTDSTLKKEPFLEMKKCDLTWSILSTVVDYTENDKENPYKEMNHSPIYSRFEDTKDLILGEQSDLWSERFRKSLVTYIVVTSLMILMMLALLIWYAIDIKEKREPFQ